HPNGAAAPPARFDHPSQSPYASGNHFGITEFVVLYAILKREAFSTELHPGLDPGWRPVRVRKRVPPKILSPGFSPPRWRGDTGEQDGKYTGEEDPVECSCAANRGDGSAETPDLVEVEKVGANERSHRAADIGKRRGVL